MDSSMIGKIEKARRYATEARGRIVFLINLLQRLMAITIPTRLSLTTAAGPVTVTILSCTNGAVTPKRWNTCWKE
jgi:hypothetical protein